MPCPADAPGAPEPEALLQLRPRRSTKREGVRAARLLAHSAQALAAGAAEAAEEVTEAVAAAGGGVLGSEGGEEAAEVLFTAEQLLAGPGSPGPEPELPAPPEPIAELPPPPPAAEAPPVTATAGGGGSAPPAPPASGGGAGGGSGGGGSKAEQTEALSWKLVGLVASLDRGFGATEQQAEEVDRLARQLSDVAGPVVLSWQRPGKSDDVGGAVVLSWQLSDVAGPVILTELAAARPLQPLVCGTPWR